MNSWFTVKVKYTKQLENGTFKRVSEPYLLAAMTFTDAEARIYEELGSSIRGEFQVTGIARTDLHDIFQYDDAEQWFKCKVTYDRIDEDGEKAKTISQNFLVSAAQVKEAYERIEESLATLMIDFNVVSITASPIVEIFPYREEDVQSPAQKAPKFEEETTHTPIRQVFSASGSDSDDDLTDEDVFYDEDDSELTDETAEA
ncbi:MAG: DUF4494 domain-containing protein [Crocinitomicaceae bacterium]|jgi:hypothetical protein|nr:DUF4494 domain-containing protein [Crocinitomicaceae bacterium]MDP4723999.1 DUF4494 domain-containing protein [Crocinitomicaceae bacterium]MDP4739320.1 DUF4494 domain-containing protein [Crocinitomicaceae bacterium]MDP4798529.1 DUF4494 domain-containing protein [Crocinitomicaceae bacterium]MDP4806998.1 DUF4494 domain-containing protein [Crocinitomicaceae bacterium]